MTQMTKLAAGSVTYLVLCVRCQDIESPDGEPELAAVRELAEAGAQ